MIEVSRLAKKYRIYQNGFSRLKDFLTPSKVQCHEEFWALKDISFRLAEGECLGIIGANGAGKSTLLRILSGTTKPTSGDFSIQGRIASLLELGLGFHSWLSGRENIILAAKFLGLDEKEVRDRLDGMIEFAELGKFIDLPIRTYSSGMFVRLGFAVAAGIDPDVLIIDEVLSVGDDYFQRKSLSRVEYFKDIGKSILIVSHSMPVIQRFCDKTLWLHEGETRALDETQHVAREYELFSRDKEAMQLGEKASPENSPGSVPQSAPAFKSLGSRWGTGEILIRHVEMLGEDKKPKRHFVTGETITVQLSCYSEHPVEAPIFGLLIHSINGTLLFATANFNIDPYDFGRTEGEYQINYHLDHLNLNKGTYFLSVAAFLKPDHPFWDKPSDFHNQMYEFKVWSDKIEHGYLHMTGGWSIESDGK